jgi:hypothetical protein
VSTKPRVSDERLSEMIANAGLYAYVADPGEVEGLARDLRDARADINRLRREYDGEVYEFNAGFECAQGGGTLDDEPSDTKYDSWRVGFSWFEIDKLRARIAELEAGK